MAVKGEIMSSQVVRMKIFVDMLKAMAMWPRWRSGFWFTLWYFSTICTVSAFIGAVTTSLFLKIFTSFTDMDGIATVIDFATVYASGLFRFLYIFFKGAKFKHLVDTIHDDFSFESLNPIGLKRTMKSSEILGKRWAFFYFYGSSIFIFQMIIVPIFVRFTDPSVNQIPFIFQGWLPFNGTLEPHHSIVFSIQATSWLFMGYLYLLMDAFLYMILFVTLGQLQIITHTYQHMVPLSEQTDCSIPLPQYTNHAVIRAVKQHQIVRRMIGDLEEILNPIIIVDFIHAMLSITFLLLDVTIALSNNDWAKILHLSEYLIISIVHMFAYDYMGNELVLQEEKLAKAMYSVPWYRSMDCVALPLMLTTAAARKPIRLTGGKFYNLTLEFFVMAMKSIFSYFMVLLQLRDEAEEGK